jgi:prepilin-type N-terminal cleavage/methylation domain-containing protein
MRKQKGFSLIELLIVVAIILIIAAIAIPNLLRARMSANESSAAAGIRTISTAEVTYFTTYQLGYADSLTKLGTPAAVCSAPDATTGACLIDGTLTASGTTPKSGYIFDVTGTNADAASHPQGFVASSYAQTWNRTGLRSFCATEDNVVHVKVETAQGAAITATATCAALAALNN